jgi:hypothetical protein
MPWQNPKSGEKYRRRGYTFRVDSVSGGDVYVYQSLPYVDTFRVKLAKWRRGMANAKPINGTTKARRKVSYKLCKQCGQPILKRGQRRKSRDDYRHARGCRYTVGAYYGKLGGK